MLINNTIDKQTINYAAKVCTIDNAQDNDQVNFHLTISHLHNFLALKLCNLETVPRIPASLTNDLEMYREKVNTALRLIYILL